MRKWSDVRKWQAAIRAARLAERAAWLSFYHEPISQNFGERSREWEAARAALDLLIFGDGSTKGAGNGAKVEG